MGMLRTLLALAVALNHGNGAFGYWMMHGDIAVQCFYTISGFLISHILLTKYDATPRGTWLFYSNRALRIYVPYWTVLLATVLSSMTIYVVTNHTSAGPASQWLAYGNELDVVSKGFVIFTNIFLFGQDLCLWLVKEGGTFRFDLNAIMSPDAAFYFNIVTPAWTLAVELMFYVLAPFLLRRSSITIGLLLIVSMAAKFLAYRYGYQTSATRYRFFPFELSMFLIGALSYRFYQWADAKKILSFRRSAIITAATVLTVLTLQWTELFTRQYQMNLVALLALPALFHFSREVKWDRWIGELSYPVYLIHLPVQVTLDAIWTPTDATTALGIALIVTLSILLVQLVVTPLDQWRERRVHAKYSIENGVSTSLSVEGRT